MEGGARFPTTEVLGYCRMSFRDMNAMYFLQIGGMAVRGNDRAWANDMADTAGMSQLP
jgi:hypothetical protein